jgi:RNA polymerase sigma factor (sigma-70 family)
MSDAARVERPVVFVVDDDPSLRRTLQRLFVAEGLACETFASAPEFLAQYDASRPGCLLLDVRMPDISGLELQERLEAQGGTIPIVFMTAHADVPMTVRAMKGGAVDFVEKPFNEQLLLEAVQRALAADRQARQRARAQRRVAERLRRLTSRERQVLERVVAGRTNREIAEEWGISEKTIKVHRGRVMEKMGAKSLPELVLLAQQAGIRTTLVGDSYDFGRTRLGPPENCTSPFASDN